MCDHFDAKFRSNAATVIDGRPTRAISSFTQLSGQPTYTLANSREDKRETIGPAMRQYVIRWTELGPVTKYFNVGLSPPESAFCRDFRSSGLVISQ